MHDVNRMAERVLFDEPNGIAGLVDEELDPLELSARASLAPVAPRPIDAASVPPLASPRGGPSGARALAESENGRPSRAVVLATLERWLQNLERGSVGGRR